MVCLHSKVDKSEQGETIISFPCLLSLEPFAIMSRRRSPQSPAKGSKNGPILQRPSQSLLDLYAELGRYGNPFPPLMIYFPHLIGSLLAACAASSSYRQDAVAPESLMTKVLVYNLLFIPASAVLHGLGCTWNDLIDAPLDKLVERTRNRPIPRGAISKTHALLYYGAQTAIWLALLGQVSPVVVVAAVPLIPAVAFYPFAKRFFAFPSAVLGVILAYGAVLGFTAVTQLELDPSTLGAADGLSRFHAIFSHADPGALRALLFVGISYTLAVTSIDMIYAHQDLADDPKAGIRSMAVTFRYGPKMVLATLALAQFGFSTVAGNFLGFDIPRVAKPSRMGPWFLVGCMGALLAQILMVWRVNLSHDREILWWFQTGSFLIGTSMSLGLGAELCLRLGVHGWDLNL